MRRILLALLLTALTTTAYAAEDTDILLARLWPYAPYARLTEIGTGVGIVFSPDLSVDGNCRFYVALGFACFEDTDWSRVLQGVHDFNEQNPDRAVRTLILETHGTNGNGLKLQKSKKKNAERSYISVGALQERLEPEGIRYIVLSACNSRRLLRPEIVRNLDPNPGDKLFLPATCGIFGASAEFHPRRSRVTVLTSEQSQIEATLVGSLRELAPATRRALEKSAKERGIELPDQFAVSEMLIRMLLRDDKLELRPGASIAEMSQTMSTTAASEHLFDRFVAYLRDATERGVDLAASTSSAAHTASTD